MSLHFGAKIMEGVRIAFGGGLCGTSLLILGNLIMRSFQLRRSKVKPFTPDNTVQATGLYRVELFVTPKFARLS